MKRLQPGPRLAPTQRTALRATLRRVFGLTELRPAQELVIANVLASRHTLAIMPTGAGKSLCYQLPVLVLKARAVIVSPLISLMKDQVDKLSEAGVHAVAINSALNAAELTDALASVRANEADFVFTTPERLADASFIELLNEHPVDLLVIDEAHCISQWGHDFRPAFLEIGAAHRALGEPPLLALTATANARVIEDVATQLGVRFDVLSASVYRDNLHLRVRPATSEEERFAHATDYVRTATGSGIVYTATVKAAVQLHEHLTAAGEACALYHGRLSSARRHDEQDAFMRGDARVMVATNAFGLGIDKSDIRFVMHFQLPPNLDAYYQEAGRAGRDGDGADCLLLYFHQDRRLRQFLQAGRYPTVDDVLAVLDSVRLGSEHASTVSAQQLAKRLPVAQTKVHVALQLLKQAGAIKANRRRELQFADAVDTAVVRRAADEYRLRDERDRAALERMVFYAQTGFCRWKVLLEHFGEGEGFDRCGVCDNCVSPPLRRLTPPKRRTSVVRPARPRSPYRPGDYAHVRRYGVGRVVAATAASVTLEFPDGSTRRFVPQFVRRAAK